ncbi:hypothetical protein G6011_03379 [Alternaria panax]|uniref:J domain-containing protein n=1 Tax=Alternaria panax TaxID=48097 RepID=A0AAD4NT37_9PLEO|nr:hypothetical protein G6011_03379 [Alternaria panax]
MSNAYLFNTLGLKSTATEAAVRTSFKLLALIHHPDKAVPGREKEAIRRFCEIQHAYEFCLSHPDPNGYDVKEGGDGKGWDGELPAGILNANSAWWNKLKGNEPAPALEWARACEKALRFASVKLDKLERYMLHSDYRAAYDNFENWRRKHKEEPKEEERIQQDIRALPARIQSHARTALSARRAAPEYYQDNYQEDHDEEWYFTPEAMEGEEAWRLTGTWRNYIRCSINSKKTSPQQYLALFRKQVAALERRSPTFGIEDRSPADEKRSPHKRNATEARLVKAVKRDEQYQHSEAMKKKAAALLKHAKESGPSVRSTAATLEELVPAVLNADPEDGREMRARAALARMSLVE